MRGLAIGSRLKVEGSRETAFTWSLEPRTLNRVSRRLSVRRHERGLTLVELVVGISLSAILGIALGVLVSEHLRAALRARDMTVATNVARAELERLESLGTIVGQENTTGFCHPDLNLTAGVLVPALSGPSYIVTRIVTCQTGSCVSNCASPSNANNGIKRIEIRVTKTSSAGERQAYLITYRTKFVLFGT